MQDRKTEKCGTKLPNAWGIFNMLGNAGELCQDWYRDVAVVDSDVSVDLDFQRAGRGGMPGASPPFVAVWTRMPWGRLDVHREIEILGGGTGFRVARTISP
jgi:formylglycine-generating enzyme required for sulfatase activity